EYHIQLTPSGEIDGNTVVYRNYATDVKACVRSGIADRAEISVSYEFEGEPKSHSGTVEVNNSYSCFSAKIQADDGEVKVKIAFYRGSDLLDVVERSYRVVGHMNDVNITVVDVDTGRPVEGAHVSLIGSREHYSGETDENGDVFFQVVDDSYDIEIKADGYLPLTIENVEISSGTYVKTVRLFKPVEDPELTPVAIKDLDGSNVAAVVPGKKYTVLVRVALPPRIVSGTATFHLMTEYSAEDLVKAGGQQQIGEEDSNSVKEMSFEIHVPESVPIDTTLEVHYTVSVEVKKNVGETEVRETSGTVPIGVVPRDMHCGGHEYAVRIVPFGPDENPKDGIVPPRSEEEVREIRVYYAPCTGGEIERIFLYRKVGGKEELIGTKSVSGLDRFEAGYVSFSIGVSPEDEGRVIVLQAKATSNAKIVGADYPDGFPVGHDVCVEVWAENEKGGTPTDEGNVLILARPKDCDTGEIVEGDITVYIRGGTAGLGRNPPIELRDWDGDRKAYYVKLEGVSAGTVYLDCDS
ncbi:TPA: carboxypeptidase regulatory-like domain-containing protein, partial [Candidatus Micrarchaeota archaeon]|nr:carboxypeptidase regulatory-like domain-containing protein [Candidatus Micrarchaeota archaeon]